MTEAVTDSEQPRGQAQPLQRRILTCLIISATITLAIALVNSTGLFSQLENWIRDWRMSVLGPEPPVRSDIVVIGLDEETLESLPYRSPVDRKFLTELLDTLAEAKVRAVGIDLLFDRHTEPEKDAMLQERLRNFPAPLVVVWSDVGPQVTESQKAYMDEYLAGVNRGYANLLRDSKDNVVRWNNILHEDGKEDLPGFPAAMAKALDYPLPDTNIELDYATWPTGEASAFPTFSALQFVGPPLLKKAMMNLVRGKIVLIGGVLREIDRYPTPFVAGLGNVRGTIPGVVIHAHALAQIIDGRRVRSTGTLVNTSLIAVAALLGAGIATLAIPIWAMMGLGAIVLSGLVVSLVGLYALNGLLVPVFTPNLGFLAALMIMSFYQQRRFHEERTFIRGALSRYVAEDVVQQLEHEPWRLKLGGERRNLTYLFTDIADFTTLSEITEPMVLVSALNQYLDGASRVILESGGTIDKYIGDAIVVVFGAFGDHDDHAQMAVKCALALDRFASEFARAQQAEGLNFGTTRIGINTGNAIIGNFGGDLRFDYTSIGDAVNTAARLEGANKYFGTRICISGSCYEACSDIQAKPIGRIVLKGKTDAIPVYQPVNSEDDPEAVSLTRYMAAYDLLASGDPAAKGAFESLHGTSPDDPLIDFHYKRLQQGETGAEITLEDK